MPELTFLLLLCITIALISVALSLARLLRAFLTFHQDYLRIHGSRLL